MTQILIDGQLAYDSRLEDYDLLGLTITTGLNKGGSAAITMPSGHPAYNSFVSFRSIVEIYQDKVLKFRGRPLYPTDDFFGRRTITCEGERCFLRDGVSRPYDYRGSPAEVFAAVIADYNAQADATRQFVMGTVTVTDANDYIRLWTETAEQISDTVDKLVERCGGYIVFTANTEGKRVINWYASSDYRSTQAVQFGENLLGLSRSANTELATRIVPYGAKDEEAGTRLTIESVNDGVDYVEDVEAVALRGVIARPVVWEDVTEPANLKTKALQYLASSKMIITSLELSAVDLAAAGRAFDQFRVGDNVHVVSAPHGVDDWLLLEDLTEDLLDPAGSTISLGKSYATLTGADVAGDRKNQNDLQQVDQSIREDYTRDVADAVEKATVTLASLIQQTSESIQLMVAEKYATNDDLQAAISTQITQLADSITFQFTQLRQTVDENDAEARAQFQEFKQYIRFEEGNIILGEVGNEITLRIENDRISFLNNGVEVAYFSNRKLYVLDGEFLNSLKLGVFGFLPRGNKNLSFKKVVD